MTSGTSERSIVARKPGFAGLGESRQQAPRRSAESGGWARGGNLGSLRVKKQLETQLIMRQYRGFIR